jgi:hypothetical protein
MKSMDENARVDSSDYSNRENVITKITKGLIDLLMSHIFVIPPMID